MNQRSHLITAGALSAVCAALLLVSTAWAAEPTGSRTDDVTTSSDPGVVNINTATQSELERLPGIGPAKARAILETRANMKGFRRIQDILRVRGIGRATFRKLRPMLTVDGPTTLAERPRRPTRS